MILHAEVDLVVTNNTGARHVAETDKGGLDNSQLTGRILRKCVLHFQSSVKAECLRVSASRLLILIGKRMTFDLF